MDTENTNPENSPEDPYQNERGVFYFQIYLVFALGVFIYLLQRILGYNVCKNICHETHHL